MGWPHVRDFFDYADNSKSWKKREKEAEAAWRAWHQERDRLYWEAYDRRNKLPDDKASYERFVAYVRTTKRLRCYWCRKWTKRGRKRHIDHIHPIGKGGTNCIFNLCVACVRCNSHKHDKLAIEFKGQGELHFW